MTPDDTPQNGLPADDQPGEELLAPGDRAWQKPWMGPFLKALSILPDVSAAARSARVGRKTVYRWQEKDVDFAQAWKEALDIARDGIQRVAFQWATTGVPVQSVRTVTKTVTNAEGEVVTTTSETVDTRGAERSATLMIFWLKAWYPDRYRWKEGIEMSGDPDSPIQISTMSEIDREIERLSAELATRAVQTASQNGHGELSAPDG